MHAYDAVHFVPPAPVARVTLRNSQTRVSTSGVELLVDTRADVTLLPRAAIARIGVVPLEEPGYEVTGFGGSTSVAPVAELDLLFLRSAFRGRYLLIDEERGYLGRDILGHVALLLNGPGQHWSEQEP